MYKVLNFLFGWDYIHWKNTCDYGIARIRKSHNEVVWYYRYRITKCVDRLENPSDVIWLTCHPSKYFKYRGYLNKE
jgi:hypothetical protein